MDKHVEALHNATKEKSSNLKSGFIVSTLRKTLHGSLSLDRYTKLQSVGNTSADDMSTPFIEEEASLHLAAEGDRKDDELHDDDVQVLSDNHHVSDEDSDALESDDEVADRVHYNESGQSGRQSVNVHERLSGSEAARQSGCERSGSEAAGQSGRERSGSEAARQNGSERDIGEIVGHSSSMSTSSEIHVHDRHWEVQDVCDHD